MAGAVIKDGSLRHFLKMFNGFTTFAAALLPSMLVMSLAKTSSWVRETTSSLTFFSAGIFAVSGAARMPPMALSSNFSLAVRV
jgi:hypothetical protein